MAHAPWVRLHFGTWYRLVCPWPQPWAPCGSSCRVASCHSQAVHANPQCLHSPRTPAPDAQLPHRTAHAPLSPPAQAGTAPPRITSDAPSHPAHLPTTPHHPTPHAVYAVKPLSGGHLNPAVSLASAVSGHIDWARGLMYTAAQVLGAIMGALLQASGGKTRAGRGKGGD